MPRPPAKPPYIFIVGCLFILLVTSVQIWRGGRQMRSISSAASIPAELDRETAQATLEVTLPRQYGAEIRAEEVLAIGPRISHVADVTPPVASQVPIDGPLAIELPSPEPTETVDSLDSALTVDLDLRAGDLPLTGLVAEVITPVPSSEAIFPELPRRNLVRSPDTLTAPAPVPSATALPPVVTPAIEPAPSATSETSKIALPANEPSTLTSTPAAPPEPATEVVAIQPQPAPRAKPRAVATRPKNSNPAIAEAQVAKAKPAWPQVQALQQGMPKMHDPDALRWSVAVKDALYELSQVPTIESVRVQQPLQKLKNLAEQAASLSKSVADGSSKSGLLVAGYALQRRIDLWESLRRASHPQVIAKINKFRRQVDPQRMLKIVATTRGALGSQQNGLRWSEFFLLDELEGLATSTFEDNAEDARHTAVRVLNRLQNTKVNDQQLEFLRKLPVVELETECRRWATTNINYSALLAKLEEYEFVPAQRTARLLADTQRQLKWSLIPQQNDVAARMKMHYDNANVRVALTQDFINRLLPVMQDVRTPIREEILGAQVFGNSASWTKIGVRLIPDDDRIRLQMLAVGLVDAQTQSFKGPVVLHNHNRSHYHLRKNITIGKDGAHIGRSDAVASGSSRVLGFRTEYDRFPVIGGIVRRATKQQILEQGQLVRRIFERRVAIQAEDRVDAQVTQQIAALEKRLNEKVIAPLRKMGLDPQPIDMRTTKERIVFRGRLSGDHQLGGYTTRPRALANSLFSVQLHESSFNNVVEQLGIDGRQGNLRTLLTQLFEKLKGLEMAVPDDVPDDVTIKFADTDAVRFRLDEGRIRISLRIKQLSTRRRTWKDFIVAANYAPNDNDGFQVELHRDGVVELAGRRLRTRDQVALRGIFGIVFDKNRTMQLVHPDIANDPRLVILHVNQFVIRDGWVGLSVSADPGRYARLRAAGQLRR